ncbi:unannotated protein [freshwater metagenome]|uniref:Unannotated protein n=1 Tax=freshwater metagenome TaxID=449393 RepID=A0A6J7D7M5_9ZZZZ
MTTPMMIWSTLNFTASTASRSASTPPVSVAASNPTQPPSSEPMTTPVKAPPRSMPSMPMFTTPERSHRMPDRAPRAIGVERDTVATSMLMSENSWPEAAHTMSARAKTPNEMPRIIVVLPWNPRKNCVAPRNARTDDSTHSEPADGTASESSWMASFGVLSPKVETPLTAGTKTSMTRAESRSRTMPEMRALRICRLVSSFVRLPVSS